MFETERVWDCMFCEIGADGLGVELHREKMTFAEADIFMAANYPGRSVYVLVPEDFPPYGMEGGD